MLLLDHPVLAPKFLSSLLFLRLPRRLRSFSLDQVYDQVHDQAAFANRFPVNTCKVYIGGCVCQRKVY